MSCCKNKCRCAYPCNFIPIPDNNELKTIALLELSGDGGLTFDITLKKTFEYYFENNSKQFKSFPIIDTNSSLEKTIELLEYYYIAGYRIFIGFNRSKILEGVLTWFNNHPKALGISIESKSPSLDIPKNIYRLTPSQSNLLENIKLTDFVLTRRYIFYVYSKGELTQEFVLKLLTDPLSPVKDKIVAIPIIPDSSNISDVQTTYISKNYNPLQDIAIDYLTVKNQRQNFIDLFSFTFIPIPTFDISLQIFPTFNDNNKIVWSDLYYCYRNINLSTSPLWRVGYKNLGNINYNTQGLNALQLNNFLKTKTPLEELSNYAFVEEFNQNKDTIYFSYSDFKYNFDLLKQEQNWIPDSVFVKDPIFGTFYQVLS